MQPNRYPAEGYVSRKDVIIRCRKCWEDVRIQKQSEEVPPCPKCGKQETYVHAIVTKYQPKGRRASRGSTSSG